MYDYYEANLDDGSVPTDHFRYCENGDHSAYNEVEVYKYNSGAWDGPYVYFAESMPWPPSSWNPSFYTSVWADELDMSNFETICYTNKCDENICPVNEFCREEWIPVQPNGPIQWGNGNEAEKLYYCCPSESADLSECEKVYPGYSKILFKN